MKSLFLIFYWTLTFLMPTRQNTTPLIRAKLLSIHSINTPENQPYWQDMHPLQDGDMFVCSIENNRNLRVSYGVNLPNHIWQHDTVRPGA